MSCQEYQDLILSYHEDELGRAERQELERHLAECSRCRKTAADLGLALQIFQAVGQAEPGAELPPDLAARVAERAAAGRPVRRSFRARIALGLGAAAVVIAMAGAFLLNSRHSALAPAPGALSLTSIQLKGRGIGVEIGANTFVLHSRDKDGRKGIDLEF